MARPRNEHNDVAAQDSFLDVVTNIVGIMIILVMVAGIRARKAPITPEELSLHVATKQQSKAAAANAPVAANANTADTSVITQEEAQLRAALEKHASMQGDIAQATKEMRRIQTEWAVRKDGESQLTTYLAAGQFQLEQLKAKMSTDEQQNFDMQQKLQAARSNLQQLDQATQITANTPAETVEIAYVTPLSKVVDGEEVHFQCRGGRVVAVPMQEFIKQLRKEFESVGKQIRSPMDLQNIVKQEYKVGPVDNFEMRFMMKDYIDYKQSQRGLVLRHFEIVPLQLSLGETKEEALAPDSKFHAKVHDYSPRQATITVWVYPDSFPLYRAIEDDMRKQGYTVAGRLKQAGSPISGSPSGTKSLAQ